MNLYIIGNGFDLMHNLPTRYSDFAKFCIETDLTLFNEMNKCFPSLNLDGLWANFEKALGDPDKEYLTKGIKNRGERDYDIGVDTEGLKSAFGSWVYNLNQSLKYLTISRIFYFRKDDIFVTFNYTNVLERVYNINSNNILHIHEGGKDVEDTEIFKGYIYGHNVTLPTARSNEEQEMKDYIESLRKEPRIKELIYFINKVDADRKIDNIIVIGHSMAEVDHDYFKKLVEIYNDVHWNIHYFNTEDLMHKINNISDIKIKNYCLIADR